jgi:hypothetical protein
VNADISVEARPGSQAAIGGRSSAWACSGALFVSRGLTTVHFTLPLAHDGRWQRRQCLLRRAWKGIVQTCGTHCECQCSGQTWQPGSHCWTQLCVGSLRCVVCGKGAFMTTCFTLPLATPDKRWQRRQCLLRRAWMKGIVQTCVLLNANVSVQARRGSQAAIGGCCSVGQTGVLFVSTGHSRQYASLCC